MRRSWLHRAGAGLVVPAVVAAVSAVALPAGATTPTCSTTDTSFCWQLSLGLYQPGTTTTPTAAAVPADLVATMQNTSTDLGTSTAHWIDHVTLALPSATMPVPSASLPNNLAVAPPSATCASAGPAFNDTACPAGFGHFWANTAVGIEPGTFGIENIANVSPPASGSSLDYQATIAYCISTPVGACNVNGTSTLQLTASSTSPGTITFPLSTTIAAVTSVPIGVDQVSLHLWGTSDKLADGSAAPSTYQVFRMPAMCGTATVNATATDTNGAATTPVTSFPFPVSGCPTASFTDTESAPYTTRLNGSASTAQLDRTVASWIWTFGDGTGTTTATPAVSHVYGHPGSYTVTLVVKDSVGAISPLVARRLLGTTLTEAPSASTISYGQAVTLRGRLTRLGTTTGLGGYPVAVYRCVPGTTSCTYLATLTTSTTSTTLGDWSYTTKPAHNSVFRALFAGRSPYLGSAAATTEYVRSAVSIRLSTTTPAVDQFVTIYGTVGPNQAGRSVLLERYSGGTWTVVARPTLSSGSAYAYDVVPTARGTYTYRVVDPSNTLNLAGASRAISFTAG